MTSKVVFAPSMIAARTVVAGGARAAPAVAIHNGDMFAHARALVVAQGKRVALHNFANNFSPGLLVERADGTHMWQTNTQEEQLLRASTVDGKTFLPRSLYPISTPGAVAGLWTPAVAFTRTPRGGLPLPEADHYTADVVTCAALMRPKLVGAEYAPGVEDEVIKHMVLVLTMAKDADVFVTGLWGCGAFSHPIKASLKAWRRALHTCSAPPPAVHFCYKKDNLTMLMSEDEESVDVMALLL